MAENPYGPKTEFDSRTEVLVEGDELFPDTFDIEIDDSVEVNVDVDFEAEHNDG